MNQPKLSFLIAAHNEERIIEKPLQNLLRLPYKDYEVIIGLDGCTDRTEDIVKKFCDKSRKFRYYKLNLRQGKAAVINKIIEKASGEIIIIHDADWLFKVRSKKDLEKFISAFDDIKIGGIAEPFPVEWEEGKIKKGNLGYKLIAYSSYFWIEFQKEKFTYKKNNLLYLKEPAMFLTDVFRKELYKKNMLLCDDIERTNEIMKKKREIVLFNDLEMPRMIVSYNKISVKDLFKQKIRTAIARKQLANYTYLGLREFYLPLIWYMLKNSFKKRMGIGFIVSLWLFLTSLATFLSKFKKMDTKKGWTLRARK